MDDIIRRHSYSTRRRVVCPKCGKPVKTIRSDRYGICRACIEVFEIPEAAAEHAAEAAARSVKNDDV